MTMISIALLDASMMTGLSVPPAKLCPDLGLVTPATPEQSPHTEHQRDVPLGTARASATLTKCRSYNYDWAHSGYLLEWSNLTTFSTWHCEEELRYSIELIASTVKQGGLLWTEK
jgi:hypothetical protein